MTSTNKQTLVNSINSMDLNASGNPLGPQLSMQVIITRGISRD